MKKILLGTIIGVVTTITVQRLYRKNKKFRIVVDKVSHETGIGPAADDSLKALNVFERISIIFSRLSLAWKRTSR
jgi:hypothetical protein